MTPENQNFAFEATTWFSSF